MMEKLTEEELAALKVIVNGNSLLQPAFPAHVTDRLLHLRLAKQTLGGTLKATDEGILVAEPEAVAAAIARRDASQRKKASQT